MPRFSRLWTIPGLRPCRWKSTCPDETSNLRGSCRLQGSGARLERRAGRHHVINEQNPVGQRAVPYSKCLFCQGNASSTGQPLGGPEREPATGQDVAESRDFQCPREPPRDFRRRAEASLQIRPGVGGYGHQPGDVAGDLRGSEVGRHQVSDGAKQLRSTTELGLENHAPGQSVVDHDRANAVQAAFGPHAGSTESSCRAQQVGGFRSWKPTTRATGPRHVMEPAPARRADPHPLPCVDGAIAGEAVRGKNEVEQGMDQVPQESSVQTGPRFEEAAGDRRQDLLV